MPNDAESAIYTRLAAAPRFHPASADMFMPDWTIEAGDVVEVKSGESSYNVPVYSMNLNWKGSSRVTVQSTGNEKRDPLPALRRKQYATGASAYKYTGATAKMVEQIISEVGEDGEVTVASIVMAINNSESSVTINADKIYLAGETTIDELLTGNAVVSQMSVGDLSVNNVYGTEVYAEHFEAEYGIYVGSGQNNYATWQSKQVVTEVTVSSGQVTDVQTATIYYLGRV